MIEKQRAKKNSIEPKLLNIQPHSIEAEQSVLGGLMLDNKSWDKIADKIIEQDFYHFHHRVIFRAVATLANQNSPFDIVTIAETLKQMNELENAGGEAYLFELAKNIPSAANITAYTDIVRERSIQRKLISTGYEIVELGFNPDGQKSLDLLDQSEQKIFKLAEQGISDQEPLEINRLISQVSQYLDNLQSSPTPITGLATGYADLDEITSGLQRGDLIIVAGRPSMGKTALAMNIASYVAIKEKLPVLIFSMEMSSTQMTMRLLSSLGHIDQQKMRSGKMEQEDWSRVSSATKLLSNAKLLIDERSALSPHDIRARARRVARSHGNLGLIIIDYLQLMKIPGFKENRTLEVSEISRSLKALAKELNIPVIALSQLNRGLEQRHDRRPVMSDLRDSGGLEQDADLIAFIYRDEVYNEDSPERGIAEIIISKQRNGPIGKVKLAFFGKYTRFENLVPSCYKNAIL